MQRQTHLKIRGQEVDVHEERHEHNDAQGVGEGTPPEGPDGVDVAARPQEGGRHGHVVGRRTRVQVGDKRDRQSQQAEIAHVRVAIDLVVSTRGGSGQGRRMGKGGVEVMLCRECTSNSYFSFLARYCPYVMSASRLLNPRIFCFRLC